VFQVAEDIGKIIEKYRIIVVKSTVPVGACEKVQAVIRSELEKRGLDIPFDIASNPEFLKEGTAGDGVSYGKHQYEVLEGADCLLLLTEWLSLGEPDFERIKSLMRTPVIFDGRNQYNPKTMEKMGFR